MGDGLGAGDLDGVEGLGTDEELHGDGGLGGGGNRVRDPWERGGP